MATHVRRMKAQSNESRDGDLSIFRHAGMSTGGREGNITKKLNPPDGHHVRHPAGRYKTEGLMTRRLHQGRRGWAHQETQPEGSPIFLTLRHPNYAEPSLGTRASSKSPRGSL